MIRWENHGSIEIGFVPEQTLYAFDLHIVPVYKNGATYENILFSVRDKLTCSDNLVKFNSREKCKEWADSVYKEYKNKR